MKFALSVCLTLTLSACSTHSAHTLNIGTNLWPGYEPLYLADHLYGWDQSQIRLIEYPSTTEVLRSFRNRSIQAAAMTLDEAIRLKQDNIPIKIILINDFSDGADVILAKPPIQSIAQLKGKTIAVEYTALGAFFLDRALATKNMTVDDVHIRNMDVNLHMRAYKRKDIDAVVTFEPIRTLLLKQGANEIFSSKSIPGEIVDVLVVHEDYLKQNPDIIHGLVKDWFRTLKYMKSNTREAYQFISSRNGLSIEQLSKIYPLLHIPDRAENLDMLKSDGVIEQTLNLLNHVMFKTGHTSNLIDTQGMCDAQYIP